MFWCICQSLGLFPDVVYTFVRCLLGSIQYWNYCALIWQSKGLFLFWSHLEFWVLMDYINPKCFIASVLPVVKVVWVTRHCPYSGRHQTLEFLVGKLRSRASRVERQNMNNREENSRVTCLNSLSKVGCRWLRFLYSWNEGQKGDRL